MCAICGIFNERNEQVITKMLSSISYRGPDSFNIRVKGNRSVGVCRLNLLEGEQPFYDKASDTFVLFNGEIYNFKEIGNKLINDGQRINDETEVEVIFGAYKRYGPSFIKNFKGMFAIVIIEENKVLLFRDRYGIKPLFYTIFEDKLIFGSEIKSILQYPGFSPTLNLPALEEIMVFGYILSDNITLFQNIFQVPPGTYSVFEKRTLTNTQYYSIPNARYLGSEFLDYMEQKSTLHKLLDKSVDVLMNHGEQEKGVYLSGGVDSSLLAFFASKHSTKKIKTFTLADSEGASDIPYARKVAKALHTDHFEFYVKLDDYFESLPNYIHRYENTVAGGVFDIQGGIAFHMLSGRVAKHVKVAFSGEGADELFGGYYWTYTHPLGFSDRIRNRLSHVQGNGKLRNTVERLFPLPEDESLYRKNIFDILVRGGLSNYHLWSVDRSSSGFGFEIRPPYLSDDLSEFSLRMPIDYKSENGKTKKILKEIATELFQQYGMEDVATRKKAGMPEALNHLRSSIDSFIKAQISEKHLRNHPFKKYLSSPTDVFMFDIFYYIFFINKGNLDPDFSVHSFFHNKINERSYS